MEKMVIFGPKPWLNPFGKMSIFWLFELFCFFSLERRFFVLEYRQIFSWPLLPKKQVGKMAIFGPKPWVYTFRKNVNFSTFWTSSFYSIKKCFFVLEYRKRYFPVLYCLKKVGKLSIFRPKPCVNPFGKMSIFWLFELFCFFSLERRFFVLEYRQIFSWPILPKKKKLENWPFLDQNHGLTPLEKCQFFDFLNFLFL